MYRYTWILILILSLCQNKIKIFKYFGILRLKIKNVLFEVILINFSITCIVKFTIAVLAHWLWQNQIEFKLKKIEGLVASHNILKINWQSMHLLVYTIYTNFS